ncbi:small COPII coat GTPase SAR1A [Quercus suber]|uniref:small COPII coat GTPase SAR1A n=1 Tax=Quercus suber TaxID=58331 RepID=UPI000CE2227A|nr:GTP-binding protein SAR1A-like [Quercus suber]XP_023893744.1 GTP-binding protein SAR1A-like [Quercus suber]XP_023893745.1 GTP-binding protein SAR1A-like [Quercus suber]XP_023893746.1 GTP-binding protein SAR1A-like [Quercus suber]POE59459.1 gtp-binding protein sar1a [Quercus suber]
MDFINWVQESMTRVSRFFIYQLGVFNPSETNSKEANILFLGQDIDCKEAVIFSHSDEIQSIYRKRTNIMRSMFPSQYLTSWVSSIGKIKFNFFDLGEHGIAHRVWRDHCAKMDAVVYIVNADALLRWRFLKPREKRDAILREHFLGPKDELNALLSDEAFANVPFLIFGVTFARTRLHLERRLRSFLGLPNITTELTIANARPLKVFVAKELRKDQYLGGPPEHFLAKASCKDQYLDGFKWLSQYIK